MPFLQELLARNGFVRGRMNLVPHEAVQPLFLGEPIYQALAMLPGPSHQIVRDADAQGAVRPVAHHVHVERFLHEGSTLDHSGGGQGNLAPAYAGATIQDWTPAYAGATIQDWTPAYAGAAA